MRGIVGWAHFALPTLGLLQIPKISDLSKNLLTNINVITSLHIRLSFWDNAHANN
jgi:hypothetical protein